MERKDFSDEEWRTLQFGPYWAFSAVSAQDAKIEDKEKAAFREAMTNPGTMEGALGREVMASLTAEGEAVFVAWAADDRSPADGFKAVLGVLARVDAEEANRYKGTIVWLAVNVAAASGSWFGDKISNDERTAIMTIAQMLDYNVQDAVMATTIPMVLNALPR